MYSTDDEVEEEPDREVWDKHWLEGYAEKVLMWRKSLASLKTDTATLIACGNANQYFKLNIACKRDRSD